MISAGERRFEADNVVVATGVFHHEHRVTPPFAGELDPAIAQLHSGDYRGPEQLRDGPVLVVGASHSGGDIAYELARAGFRRCSPGADTGQFPLDIESRFAPLVFPLLRFAATRLLTVSTPLGRKARPHIRGHGGPLLRVKRADLEAAGVERVHERTTGVVDGRPELAGGRDGGRRERRVVHRVPERLRLDPVRAPGGRGRISRTEARGGRRLARPVLRRAALPPLVQLDADPRRRARRREGREPDRRAGTESREEREARAARGRPAGCGDARGNSLRGVSPLRRTALASVVAAICLIAIKLVTGLAAGSLGLVADAAHSGTDLVAALLTLFAVGVATRPADQGHLYGHGKAEHLAALAEAAFLALVSVGIGALAVARLAGWIELDVEPAWWAFAALGVVAAIDLARTIVSYRTARRYASAALLSNAIHFGSDLVSTIAVLCGLVAARAGFPEGDSIAALFVAVLVIVAAVRLDRRNVDVLMDRAPADAVEAAGTAIARLDPPVEVRRLGSARPRAGRSRTS